MNDATHVMVFTDATNRVTLKDDPLTLALQESRQLVYMHGQYIGSITGPHSSGAYLYTNWPNPEAPVTVYLLPIDDTQSLLCTSMRCATYDLTRVGQPCNCGTYDDSPAWEGGGIFGIVTYDDNDNLVLTTEVVA